MATSGKPRIVAIAVGLRLTGGQPMQAFLSVKGYLGAVPADAETSDTCRQGPEFSAFGRASSPARSSFPRSFLLA